MPIETGPATAVGADLTTVSFQSTATVTQTNIPVTFGQAFKVGALPSNNAAVELINSANTIIPCQLDVKVLHPDGSVRHAIISVIIPSMNADATVAWSIRRIAAPLAGTPPTFASFTGLNATATLTDTGTEAAGPTAGTTYTADAGALITAGQFEQWLSGPIVSEWLVRAPLKTAGGVEHPDLHARFAIRAYAGQSRAKIDYIIENTWAKPAASPAAGSSVWQSSSSSDRIYRVAFNGGADEVYRRAVNGSQLIKVENRAENNSIIAVFNAGATGLANDATVYTATIKIDGVDRSISVTGSSAQTYSQLKAVIDAQLGGVGFCVLQAPYQGIQFKSATTGSNSSVVITVDGTLFPALAMVTKYRPMRGDEVAHFANTRWKKTFWWGASPALHIIHNKQYLMDSKAVPNYQADIVPSPTKIASYLDTMLANGDIGDNGVTKAFMGDVGEAPGIGILPQWSVLWLLSQDKDAKYVMLKMGDQAGGWKTVFRDYDSDTPILFSKWPYASVTGTSLDSTNPTTGFRELLPAAVSATTIPATLNRADVSHHPDFCFLPYLVTGDHFYMEGMLFYQRFVCLAQSPANTYRDGRKCLWNRDQTRAQAWAMRTAAHTLYLLPETHPAHSDIAYEMESNRIWYETNYMGPGAQYNTPFGFALHGYGLIYNGSRGAAPWQDDFVTQAWGRAVELGFSDMRAFFNYKAKAVTGRLTSGAAFCWQSSVAYSLNFRASSAEPYYTTWNEVYLNSVSSAVASAECGTQAMADALAATNVATPATINVMANRTIDPIAYPAILQAATAYVATHAADGGADAWTVFDGRAAKPDYSSTPQHAIVPRTTAAVIPTSAPLDFYFGATGATIYGGKSAPPPPSVEVPGFDSVSILSDDGYGSASGAAPYMLHLALHGSSGSTSTTGRQYRAAVSGRMANGASETTFGFSLARSATSRVQVIRPIDLYSGKESMHLGFFNMGGEQAVRLISIRRYNAMFEWAKENVANIDWTKTTTGGGSMGAWGSAIYGTRNPDKFAAVYPDRPRWRYGYSVGTVAVVNYDAGGASNVPVGSAPPLAADDGGGSVAAYMDMIAYVSNAANKIPFIGWCCGRNDGYVPFSEQCDMVDAMRANKRAFAFAWNDGNHSTGSIMAQVMQSYPYGTFQIGRGYPLFTSHSADKDPRVDLIGGINIGLTFRNVVETVSGWSCEVTSVLGACTVDVEPISTVFVAPVAKKNVTIPAANTWVAVSFTPN